MFEFFHAEQATSKLFKLSLNPIAHRSTLSNGNSRMKKESTKCFKRPHREHIVEFKTIFQSRKEKSISTSVGKSVSLLAFYGKNFFSSSLEEMRENSWIYSV